eukprot:scaffold1.g5181.t1
MQLLRLSLQRIRTPLVSLRWDFNPAAVPLPPPDAAAAHRSYAAGLRGAAKRGAKLLAAARRRGGNLFLDPASQPQDSDLADLYDSSRFNRDDSDDEEGAGAADAAARDGAAGAPAAAGGGADLMPLPPARHTRVRSAEFVKSSVSVAQCPPARHPEFAVIGRSNVGKSSLINMLTGRASLAMVSKTPGKTRCINHFVINDSWYLVDLPGYGYARASKDAVVSWNSFTRGYFAERESLASVLLLVDASIPPMPLDVACAEWFDRAQLPYSVVFTKADKRKKGTPPAEENMAAFEQELAAVVEHLPPFLVTSSRSGRGRGEVLAHVAQLRELYNRTH